MKLRSVDLPLGMELETPRLRLCAPREDETVGAEMNAAICASWPELSLWMPWARQLPTIEESARTAAHFAWKWENRTELDFILRGRVGGRLVGRCGLHTIEPHVGRAELGYWLDSRVCGRGLMTEAAARVVEWAGELGFGRLEIRCDARNARSQSVAKRLGFEREARLRRYQFDNAGKLCDLEIWAHLF